jgi:hypothetical protein
MVNLHLRHRHTLLAQMVVDPLMAPGGKSSEHGHDALDQFAAQHLRTLLTEQARPSCQPTSAAATD